MIWRKQFSAWWRSALGGALWCAGLGLALWWMGGWPVSLSYDLLFLFRHTPPLDEVVIDYLDDISFAALGQRNAANWDRNLHAQLLDRLTDDQARLVVFDVVFSEAGTPEANANLARAIRRNNRVALAATLDYQARPQIKVKAPVRALPEFEDAAAGWGIAEVVSGPGRVARQYYQGVEDRPSLPWVAAALAGAQTNKPAPDGGPETWLNYYGGARTLPGISFSQVSNQPAGFFRGKCVFVGARPKTLKAHDEADEFRTPHTLWTGEFFPGVELTATAFLNLLRQDGLRFWGRGREGWWVLLAGLLLGAAFGPARPAVVLGVSAGLAGLLLILALQAAQRHLWFPWTVVALGQIPAALAWSIRGHFGRLKFEQAVLERTLAESSRRGEAGQASLGRNEGVVIPDHALVRRVGQGAYGEVWLARSTIGVFHAVKLVRRRDFPNDEPYEREFRGMQKFMPISRSHPGLVHVLHVGRNDAAGFFFYIMEAGDDVVSGQRIDPERYVPRTLAGELARRGRLEPGECLALGLALARALEHLHQQQLVHRDIKPGNIIYVQGEPKFADVGLVTDLVPANQAASHVGTEGYIPPEGPGTAAADVYALGKVLYEASMGRDRRLFPEVPTTVWEQPEDAMLRRLNDVIHRACETNARDRYPSARELHARLLDLQGPAESPGS